MPIDQTKHYDRKEEIVVKPKDFVKENLGIELFKESYTVIKKIGEGAFGTV